MTKTRQPGAGRPPGADTLAENNQAVGLQLPERLPQPPRGLSKAAKAEWRRVGKMLRAAGILTHVDLDALAHYCRARAEYDEYSAAADENPSVERNFKTGHLFVSPYHKLRNEAHDRLLVMMREFGMTPAARNKVPQVVVNAEAESIKVTIEYV